MTEKNEPTHDFGPTQLDLDVNNLINEIANEQAEAVITAPVEPAPAPEAVAPNTAAENTVEAPAEAAADRGLERLVAREVELRERETKLSGVETEMAALRARLRELEPRVLTEDHINKIKLSPQEGLRALGLDPDEIVRTALVEKLGDKANDPALRETMERTRIRKEMEALRSQVQQAEMRNQAQAFFNQTSSGAREFISNQDGLSKHAPTVAAVVKTNPDRVHAEIMEEIIRDASVRQAREPNGDIISYEEAARRVEARWSDYRSLLGTPAPQASTGPTPGPTPTTTPIGAPKAPSTPPATIKPPDRPMAPWLQGNKDEDEAIREATLEWQRVEQSRRR